MTSTHALDVVFASVLDPTLGRVNLKGLLVDSSGGTATIAVEATPPLTGIESQDVVKVGLSSVCFIKLRAADLTFNRPAGWTSTRTIKPLPVPSEVMTAYDEHEGEVTAASSVELEREPPRVFLGGPSGSNVPVKVPRSSSPLTGVPANLARLLLGASSLSRCLHWTIPISATKTSRM